VTGCSATLPRRDTVSGGGEASSSKGHNGRGSGRGRGIIRGRGGAKHDYRFFHWKNSGFRGRGKNPPRK
jgi:hypothetical protein